MSSSSLPLIEPAVLMYSKEYLLPTESTEGHAVVDTQFAVTDWGSTPVPTDVRERLEPMAPIRLSTGEPDMLVALPKESSYHTVGDINLMSPPLAAIEAKGKTSNSAAVSEAISQAHRHFEEVNISIASVPKSDIEQWHKQLASDLNVGLLGVESDGTVTVEETPRIAAAAAVPIGDRIRYNAQIGTPELTKLTKNSPKNPLGYAVCVAADGETDALCEEYVISSVADCRRDARSLGLIVDGVDGQKLTPLGQTVVHALIDAYGSLTEVLEVVQRLRRRSKPLIQMEPILGLMARWVVLEYPGTRELIDVIDHLMENTETEPSLELVTKELASRSPDLAVELFVNQRKMSTEFSDGEVFDSDGNIRPSVFEERSIYHTNTIFQYKAFLVNAGILTEYGVDSQEKLDPKTEVWALRSPRVSWKQVD